MNMKPIAPQMNTSQVNVSQVDDGEWHAIERGLIVGSGDTCHRPDGRLFVSIDSWHTDGFDLLAEAMLATLPGPLYTVVHESDTASAADWQRFGFTVSRREREFTVPTDPRSTGLASAVPPPGVTTLPLGAADERLLREVDRAIRDEVEAAFGWQHMPAEVRPRPVGDTIVDPSLYAVAAAPGRYLGLLRLVTVARRSRIGLLAVRADEQRRGIARALLAEVLGGLASAGISEVRAEIDETNHAALALFEGIGAQRTGGILELAR